MTSINYNSACHPIVQTLATTDLNPQSISDAARIFSLLKPFNQTAYCLDGCKAITKLFYEIALKVHPDKCRNNEFATDALIKARGARGTLCRTYAIEDFCDAGKPKNGGLLPDEEEAMITLETLWAKGDIFATEEEKSSIRNIYNEAKMALNTAVALWNELNSTYR